MEVLQKEIRYDSVINLETQFKTLTLSITHFLNYSDKERMEQKEIEKGKQKEEQKEKEKQTEKQTEKPKTKPKTKPKKGKK